MRRFQVIRCVCMVISGIISIPLCEAVAGSWDDSGLKRAVVLVTEKDPGSFGRVVTMTEDAGARSEILFPPSAILCFLPGGTDPSDIPGSTIIFDPSKVEGAGVDCPVAAAARAFLGDRLLETGSFHDDDEICRDLLLEVDPGLMQAEKGAKPLCGAPADILERNFYQNSEFLIGSVLVNVVFPESYGTIEDWTEDEISEAIRDISMALSSIQEQIQWVEIQFTINYRDFIRLPVTDEPILTDAYAGTNAGWKIEALEAIGFTSSEFPYDLNAVHDLNNATRREFGTDWVFTAFVVDASNHYDPESVYPYPECWGGAGYISMAYLGGPFLEIPYPACKLGYGRKFSHLFVHEMSHIFWALDEYPNSSFTCLSRAGYMNWDNGNSFYIRVGDTEPCGAGEQCIMVGVWPDPDLHICSWTMGQIGLADVNFNSIPDIYDIPPELEFLESIEATGDTTYDGTLHKTLRLYNEGIANNNPKQILYGPRIDYSPWLVKGEMRINNGLWEDITGYMWPENSSEQTVSIMQKEKLDPGTNRVYLRFENCVGLTVEESFDVVCIGLKYYRAAANAEENEIVVEWNTASNIFGADFEIYRENGSLSTGWTLLDVVDGDSVDFYGLNRNSYKWTDRNIQAATDYRYRIRGFFEMSVDGEPRLFEEVSSDILVTSVVPVVDGLLSNLMPNPFGEEGTSFSVDMPRASFDPSDDPDKSGDMRRAPQLADLKTPLNITVYNIKGEKVRTLYSMDLFEGYRTFRWDGRDDRHAPVAPGVYFVKVVAGEVSKVRKAVLIR